MKNNNFQLKKIEISLLNRREDRYIAHSHEKLNIRKSSVPEIPFLWQRKDKDYVFISNVTIDYAKEDGCIDAFVTDLQPSREFFIDLSLREAAKEKISFKRKRHIIRILINDYGMNSREVMENYLKPAGWGGSVNTVDILMQSFSFSDDLITLLEQEKIMPDTALFLNSLRGADFTALKDLFNRFIIGNNRQKQLLDLLTDIAKVSGISLNEVLFSYQDIFSDQKRTGTQQLDLLFSKLKEMKYPNYFKNLEKFREISCRISRGSVLKIEPIENFEEKGFMIQARVRSRGELENIIKVLDKVGKTDLSLLFNDEFFRNEDE